MNPSEQTPLDVLRQQFERLQREMQLIHQVGMSLTRSLDVRLIGETLYGVIAELMPCDSFVVSRYDDFEKRVRAVYVLHEKEAIDPQQFPPLPFDANAPMAAEDRSTQGRAIKTGKSLRIDDYDAYVKGDSAYYYDYDEQRIISSDEVEVDDGIARTRSALIVPLKLDERVTGVIQVMSYRIAAYTPQNMRIVEALAPHVAIALQNADLYQASRRYNQRLELLHALDSHMLQGAALEVIAQLALDGLKALLNFQRASLRLRQGEAWQVLAASETVQADLDEMLLLHTLTSGQVYEQPVAVPPSEDAGDEDDEATMLVCVISLRDQSDAVGLLRLEFDELMALDPDQRAAVQQVAAQLMLAMRDKQQRASIQQHQEELEQRVLVRTMELQLSMERAQHLSEELRQAMQQEHALGNLKARMISLVSHEFRTPLSVILSSTNLLQDYYQRLDETQRRQHLQRIAQQVDHLKALLDDVILVGKADSDGLRVSRQWIDLSVLCQQCLNEIQSISPEHQLVFHQRGLTQSIYADPLLMRQVIINLLTNAVKYAPHAPQVTLSLDYQAHQLSIQVQDQGIGIPPQDLERIGQPFQRASNTGPIPGTGLGMSIVQRVVQAHQGAFHIESQVNQGTTVTLRLPIMPSSPIQSE